MIFRFRDELREGEDVETAIVETMTHAGRSVIVSGSTVAVGLLSMVILPLPFIRSIGIGGMLIPAVSVLAAITLLPALLATLGDAHQQRPRCCRSASSTAATPRTALGPLGRLRHPPARPGRAGRPRDRRRARLLRAAPEPERGAGQGLPRLRRRDRRPRRRSRTPASRRGCYKPFVVLVEHGASTAADRRRSSARRRGSPARSRRRDWRKGSTSLVEAFPSTDGAAKATRGTIERVRAALDGTGRDAGRRRGRGPRLRHAVYSKFPYVLAFVVLLTFILLARAFRSLVLALKAVVLNLVSLAAAYGIIVFIFQ